MANETCDRCGDEITIDAKEKGWPIPMDDGYICPDCYGNDAFCSEEHVLLAGSDSDYCAECANGINVDDRVYGGETDEDYDEGTVIDINGDKVEVAWDSEVTTIQPASMLSKI